MFSGKHFIENPHEGDHFMAFIADSAKNEIAGSRNQLVMPG